MSDIAHLGPVEILTPAGEESVRFFVEILGMEIEHQEGASHYLRGWGDYQRWSVKLTASQSSGIGVLGLRASSPAALERRVALVQDSGLGIGWTDGDRGRGPSYRFSDPDGHLFELYFESERYTPPPHLTPFHKNVPARYTGRGAAIKRLDHINLLASDVRANREFCVERLGYRLLERIELDDGRETGAWMSATIAAHELIYTKDARDAHSRLHHVALWVDTREECLRAADIWRDAGITIEEAPSKHAIAQGFFLYGIEPGGNRIEITTGGRFVYAPDEPVVVWTEAERARGQAWGNPTTANFHTYGTPPVAADAVAPAAAGPEATEAAR